MNKIIKSLVESIRAASMKIINFFNLPFALVSNISTILKFSIKTKISFNYIVLYSWSFIISLVIVLLGYFYYNSYQISNNSFSYFEEIQDMISNIERSDQFKNEVKEFAIDKEVEISILSSSKEIIVVTSDSYAISSYNDIKESNKFFSEFPEFSLIKYKIFPKTYTFSNYDITFFYDISEYIINIILIGSLMIIAYFLGLMIIWIFGSMKIRRVLKPITEITKSAQNIKAENLDIRIDVGEAKYELKDLALTINDMIDRIEDSYVKQQRFVSDVSHELRTPISVINGYANMLDRWGKENPKVLQESIDALKNEASNMGDLVEKLLFLARHDKETLKYEMADINLSEIVEETIKETEMIDDSHVIKRKIEESLFVFGDYNRIKQVIRIFMDNALKYTPELSSIFVNSYKEKDMAIIEIRDSGIGISKEDLGNIFDRFYRADESRTKKTGGHGLGLSIAKIIILHHGGKIKVRSKFGYGTEFKIYFPSNNAL
ncbi:MAG: ATP-binding protein [Eubacteriaceae bacterium]